MSTVLSSLQEGEFIRCFPEFAQFLSLWNLIHPTHSAKGKINIWDALTLELLRTIASPQARPVTDGQSHSVSQVILNHDVLISTIGSRVLAWKATDTGSDRGVSKGNKKGKRSKANPTAKWRGMLERFDTLDVIS